MALVKCIECGNMISEKAQSCPKCGCPVEYVGKKERKKKKENSVHATKDSVERNKVLNELKSICDCVERIERMVKMLDETKEKIEARNSEKNLFSSPDTKSKLFIVSFIGLVIVFCIPLGFMIEDGEVAIVIACVLAGISEIFIFKAYNGFLRNSYSNDDAIQEKEKIERDIKNYCEQPHIQKSLNYLAKEYWDSETIKYLIGVIKNRRADTLKEAINLYEDYLHKAKVEAMQNKQLVVTENLTNMVGEQLVANKEQMERIEQMSRIAKSADRAAKLSAVIGVLK